MSAAEKQQVADLIKKCSEFSAANGESLVVDLQTESALFLEWLNFLNFSQKTGTADSLLLGALASLRECAACLALGMVRPALVALRTQIDLVLAWLYFKDHPIEWRTVNDHGEGFKLKREILDYLDDHYPGFKARLAVLKEVAARNTVDPYRLISAHVHAQSGQVLPTNAALSDVVFDAKLARECTILTREVAEYVSDILGAVFAHNWAAVPASVRANIEARLDGKKGARERFVAGV